MGDLIESNTNAFELENKRTKEISFDNKSQLRKFEINNCINTIVEFILRKVIFFLFQKISGKIQKIGIFALGWYSMQYFLKSTFGIVYPLYPEILIGMLSWYFLNNTIGTIFPMSAIYFFALMLCWIGMYCVLKFTIGIIFPVQEIYIVLLNYYLISHDAFEFFLHHVFPIFFQYMFPGL